MATLIEWKDHYALGIAEVDFEHREMISLINTLYSSLREGADVEEIHTFLAEVHARIAAHFALEERLMQQTRYRDYAVHKTDHERLLDDILDIMDTAVRSEDFDADTLATRLDRWFTEHFKTFDSQLHEFMG